MDTFLGNVANSLYDRYGSGISSLKIVLPNMRSRLFFQEHLSNAIGRPVWQPEYLSVDDLMGGIAGIQIADRVRTVVELYKAYSVHHSEPFDSFYFWGEMLLNDFDQIDKYMIDADMLFANLRDLKNIGGDLSYLSEDQMRIISRFWDSFGEPAGYSEHQRRFLGIWNTLGAVYHDFRSRLETSGLAYQGMVYRRAAGMLRTEEGKLEEGARYAVIGFNALSASEKILFDHIRNVHEADFFWDTDDYYLKDRDQEAGLFARENIKRYPQAVFFTNPTDNFLKHKQITAVSAASDSLQCKYAADYIRSVAGEGSVDKRTAIVLTDENLLVPLLYSLPEEAADVNVTMGYPLRQTLAYSFVERLLKLQDHSRKRAGEDAFYHSDVTGLLRHPFILSADRENADKIVSEIVRKSSIYPKTSMFAVGGLIESVFSKKNTWQEVGEYIVAVLSQANSLPDSEQEQNPDESLPRFSYNRTLQREYFGTIAECVRKLANSLSECGIEITVAVFSSLLRRMLQSLRIPFSGEPLKGVQVMGILETRNLDFDNVMIMSMNDDTFPGNPSAASSFVPYNLRLAYGLPTPQHHEGVYAYYFYRLLQRAKRVDMVYCSRNDEKSSGEQSRYIYQLGYESPHDIIRKTAGVDVNLARPAAITVGKDDRIMEKLHAFLADDSKNEDLPGYGAQRYLSPTAFFAYVECPLKFYFRSVAGLRTDDEITEDIDSPMFGTILHSAMEQLYRPLLNMRDPSEQIKKLIGSREVTDAVNRAVVKEYFKGEAGNPVDESDFEGEVSIIRDIVQRYINNNILPYDSREKRYTILEVEKTIRAAIPFESGGIVKHVRFGGTADRIDLLDNGAVRIVDYKTGAPGLEFDGLEQLFSPERRYRNPAVTQILLYCGMVKEMQDNGKIAGNGVCPALYYVRNMNRPDYSPSIRIKKGEAIDNYSACGDQFMDLLGDKLTGLFDRSAPFTQCEDASVCAYCDYNRICNRY